MKYIVLLGDGMSDKKLDELGGKTPLQVARTPHMDFMAKRGRMGLARTVPEGFLPGSDVANLSVFGYDPRTCYTGRSPLEAASIGVELGPDDVAFRVNLVNLRPHGGRIFMQDYSAGHITDEEGKELLKALQEELGNEEFQFYPGVGYRHLMVWRGGEDGMTVTPPHD
ncbi:MAG TPA: phosphoglycerate mutase, partial [Geobacteraceae bacterium]|nr:phosphoglycerate mutase [Geobacteraceae bacterium]